MLAVGLSLSVRADDDDVNVGQSIDLVRRIPATSAAPAPKAQASLNSSTTDSRSGNVRLTKQMPAELTLGQEFMYQLRVQANENVADVIVRDVVPDGATYVRSEPAAEVSGKNLTWKFNEMDAGQAKDIRVWLRPDREGRIGSCATVFASPAPAPSASSASPAWPSRRPDQKPPCWARTSPTPSPSPTPAARWPRPSWSRIMSPMV